MSQFLRTIARRSASPTFRRSLIIILVAEAVTICTAWLLLDSNVSRWIHTRSSQLVRISRETATSADWSLAGTVPKGRSSALFERYRSMLKRFSQQHFPHNEGDVFLEVVEDGIAYLIDPGDPIPMDDVGKANRWELGAYSSGKTTYNTAPYSDDTGTYLAAYTPIFRDGKVVALVGAEYDSATLTEFHEIARQAFWFSIVPGVLLALAVAYVLAGMFVEPIEVFRRIEETAAARTGDTAGDDPLVRLSQREREVAELVRRGLKNREIAEKLFVAPETVKQHLKNIREKTGFTRVELAVQVAAGNFRSASSI